MPQLIKCELTPTFNPHPKARKQHRQKPVYWFAMRGCKTESMVWSTDPQLHTKADKGYVLEETGRIHQLGE
jgi:hypothetical protein